MGIEFKHALEKIAHLFRDMVKNFVEATVGKWLGFVKLLDVADELFFGDEALVLRGLVAKNFQDFQKLVT